MPAKFVDPVAMRNPGMPGVVQTVSRQQFENSWSKRGWVEAKSPAAKAAVEAATASPSADVPQPASKEDRK